MRRRELLEIGIVAVLVALAGIAHYTGTNEVVAFFVAALAIAGLARLVGTATEQLGGRVGTGTAGIVQSGLGNLPELFIALFALNDGLLVVVQSALVGSILANSVLVLGLAFLVGGRRNGIQTFHSRTVRTIATLTVLSASIMAVPSFTHAWGTAAAGHETALSLIAAGVLIVLFFAALPTLMHSAEEGEREPPHWSLATTVVVLAAAGAGAAFTSDWFVAALTPATEAMHMSQAFAGLVVVAIAGNAVENVVGVQLAAANRPDFAISVILNSSLQVALLLTPLLVFVSLFFATTLTLVFAPFLALVLILAAILSTLVVYDGESTWYEGAILIGFYVVVAASFWWG
ncbi:MAG: calcium:proton antiporter [Gaiellaceae bacterium]